jgi:hypothetical protein
LNNSEQVAYNSFFTIQHPIMRATTAIGVSPEIKKELTDMAVELRLTTKETVLVGVKAIAMLSDEQKQAIANEVHKLQLEGSI